MFDSELIESSSSSSSSSSLSSRIRVLQYDAGASINKPNIGNSALIIEELDWGG